MGGHPGVNESELYNVLQQNEIMNDIDTTLLKMEQMIAKSNSSNSTEYLPKVKQSLITNDIDITLFKMEEIISKLKLLTPTKYLLKIDESLIETMQHNNIYNTQKLDNRRTSLHEF